MSGGSWSSYDTAACRGVTRHELRLSDNKALVYEDGQIVCWNRGLLTCGDECQPWFRDARAARLHVKTKHGWSTAGLEKQLSAYNMAEVVHDMEGRPMPGYVVRSLQFRTRSDELSRAQAAVLEGEVCLHPGRGSEGVVGEEGWVRQA